LERVQKELRLLDGVSILLYDQTCAAEKRRRRKRGLYPDPPKRVFINDLVCEGCGDCSVQSNCVSIVPVETEFGRKRAIDQSSCNKDFSCLKGFCPSFVTVEGGEIRKVKPGTGAALAAEGAPWQVLPEPELPPLDKPYSLLVTGVGGTGVVTIGALLGMAAHIEGKGVTILDQTGLAQKGGAVISHLRIAKRAEDLHAVRISAGNADLVLGCDLVVSADFDALSKMTRGESKAIVNSHEVMTGEFTHKPDLHFPADELRDLIIESTGAGNAEFLDATRLATALLGDSIATNLFILGYAWQRGLIPVGETAILEAIALNGIAVDANSRAFTWGRRAAVDLPAVQKVIQPAELPESHRISESLQDLVERRAAFLTNYQNAAYGARYEALIRKVQAIEERVFPGREDLTLAVARNYFKLLAIKDEYEVARLYSAPEFRHKLAEQFTGNYRLKLNLAPPLLSRKDPETGHLIKREFGPWIFTLFKILQRLKGLRGTPFDPFGYSQDRRHERALIEEYEAIIEETLAKLAPHNYEIAVELASSPTKIRGFGHIKEANIQAAKICEAELLDTFRQPDNSKSAAE
jgi:indolepyruvate ferredoxin oxidoreductase